MRIAGSQSDEAFSQVVVFEANVEHPFYGCLHQEIMIMSCFIMLPLIIFVLGIHVGYCTCLALVAWAHQN